jgi:hypothetical protein
LADALQTLPFHTPLLIVDAAFSGFWSFLFFIAFCWTTNQYVAPPPFVNSDVIENIAIHVLIHSLSSANAAHSVRFIWHAAVIENVV